MSAQPVVMSFKVDEPCAFRPVPACDVIGAGTRTALATTETHRSMRATA